MSKVNRYLFTKNVFKETVVLFLEKENYRSFLDDYQILHFIGFKRLKDLEKRKINYVVLQGLTLVDYKFYIDNQFAIYFIKVKLLSFFRKRLKK